MNNGNYQKAYKKSYNDKNKIVTFPLSVAFHDELKRRAIYDTPEAFFKDLLEHGCIS